VTVIVALVALLLAGCTPNVRWVAPTASGSASADPSGVAGFKVAPPAWRSCRDQADQFLQGRVPSGVTYECGTIEVPQDWHRPDSGKIFHLALLRVHSQRQTNRIGSLVVNPGGPGEPGTDTAIDLSVRLPDDILTRFDLIGFDPRGVGRSDPVKCFSDADLDALFAADPDPQSKADFDNWVALNRRMAAACQAKYGDNLPLYATEQAARDMDAIRSAVGDQKLSYLGFSYGTLLGATYAQLFPRNIRAFVLDGALDPTADTVQLAEGQAKGFTLAFDEFVKWCTANVAKCPIAPDARGAVTAAIDKGRKAPITAPDGRKVTAGWVFIGVTLALYSQQFWSFMAQAVADLAKGDPKRILQLADSYPNRDSSGHYGNSMDAFNTVACDDDATIEPVDEARTLQSQWRAKYPLFGANMAIGMVTCSVWAPKRDHFPTGKAVGAPPIVVVGTINDPATPYEQTAKLAEMLGVGHVLTWEGEGHTAYPQTTCIRAAVDAYLINLTVPPDGLRCPPK
jgi:pimeloyl-ACP methyl ester carboxylesterase